MKINTKFMPFKVLYKKIGITKAKEMEKYTI